MANLFLSTATIAADAHFVTNDVVNFDANGNSANTFARLSPYQLELFNKLKELVAETGVYEKQSKLLSACEFLTDQSHNYVANYVNLVENVVGVDSHQKLFKYLRAAVDHMTPTLSGIKSTFGDVGGVKRDFAPSSARQWVRNKIVQVAFTSVQMDLSIIHERYPDVERFVAGVNKALG